MQSIESEVNSLLEQYRPSTMPFFARLKTTPSIVMQSPEVLEELYFYYQAGMHATRVMVYFLPYLNTPALRARKLQIYIDDDGLDNGDTHHAQLRRVFTMMGANLSENHDDRFGDLDTLAGEVNTRTKKFIETVDTLYARSLGAWCVTENFSDDWLHALADGLAEHCPAVRESAYFAECFEEGVEERHGEESLGITKAIMAAKPEIAEQVIADARIMAEALQDFWGVLDDILINAEHRLTGKLAVNQ